MYMFMHKFGIFLLPMTLKLLDFSSNFVHLRPLVENLAYGWFRYVKSRLGQRLLQLHARPTRRLMKC